MAIIIPVRRIEHVCICALKDSLATGPTKLALRFALMGHTEKMEPTSV